MPTGELMIPEAMCGKHAQVVRKWKRLAKRAITLGSIEAAVADEAFISVEDAPWNLITRQPGMFVEGENVLLYAVGQQLVGEMYDAAGGNHERFIELGKQLILPSLDNFWFALAYLGDVSFPPAWQPERDRALMSLTVLKKLIRWWSEFCRLDDRFSEGIGFPGNGYRWGSSTWELARNLGKSDEWIKKLLQVHPEEAFDLLLDLVVAKGKELEG